VGAGVRAFAERLERATALEPEQTIAEYGSRLLLVMLEIAIYEAATSANARRSSNSTPGTQVLTAYARIDAGTVRGDQDQAGASAPCLSRSDG
jgi:hypothetical protein